MLSHPARGAWIETILELCDWIGRKSHPARGAWIETSLGKKEKKAPGRRTPLGVRGLKQAAFLSVRSALSRTPLGVRGLKRHYHRCYW